MTTFETIVIFLLAIIAVMMLLIFAYMCWHFRSVESWQRFHFNELRAIRVNVATTAEYTQNHIAPDVEVISNNFLHLLDEGKGLPALVDIVDKMHRNLCVEIADKMVDRVYPPTYVTPCYAPNGICMNPHGDCINCPKRGTGGTWATNTSIKAEDAPLQEFFNNNKKD